MSNPLGKWSLSSHMGKSVIQLLQLTNRDGISTYTTTREFESTALQWKNRCISTSVREKK